MTISKMYGTAVIRIKRASLLPPRFFCSRVSSSSIPISMDERG